MIDDLGYYIVGTEKFYEKIPAMFRAQQLGLDVSWVFNDSVFSALDWTKEPETSLDEFYAIRARQIREEYDYVLLFCSGGADSTNMFNAFVKNGLHVDEVVGSAPVSGLRDWKHPDPADTNVENTIEETFLTQIPWLHKISQDYPKTKVTLHDYFDDMIAYKADDWLLKGNDWMHPTMAGRYNLDRYKHLKKIADSGKRIAVVQGIDKPKVIRHQDKFYLIFLDYIYNNKYDSINHPNTNPVFFYHSPQLPQLIIKQAHVTARYTMENKHIYDNMMLNDRRKTGQDTNLTFLRFTPNHSVYERGIVPAIYPSLNNVGYQAGKPDRMFLGLHDNWFYEHHQGTRIWQMMVSDLENLTSSLDKKFLMTCPYRGLLGFRYHRKYYEIGPVSNFMPVGSIPNEPTAFQSTLDTLT